MRLQALLLASTIALGSVGALGLSLPRNSAFALAALAPGVAFASPAQLLTRAAMSPREEGLKLEDRANRGPPGCGRDPATCQRD
ncbi:uncharacterized protein CLUP02_13371 [Colletotrichum lupini]|uniref:Uncharacterized protein n=1 Tax=Colletotrichum lupini TaxID=145971 RepID=A0A9Q8T2Z2_9PEZI|nr:uncharacterized protein CLUP02_13371 [Colletotrichum lupini]KAK1701950.1 hypothetical protein BDP67DRAFT_538970 [Colletotrichum lupini]UQC87850.1 hypothetical protein CLUP02_13371 [Colletotrichum lupini]